MKRDPKLSREQTPFDLAPMQTKAGTLNVGDYSIAGLESVVAIERKSLPDLVACCGRERERFQRNRRLHRGSLKATRSSWARPPRRLRRSHAAFCFTQHATDSGKRRQLMTSIQGLNQIGS